jgi:hypothetical protein
MTLVISQKLQNKVGYCNAILFQKSVREEMEQLRAQSEKNEVELRKYYQKQLDALRTCFQEEMEQLEHELNEVASQQLQQMAET